MSTDNMTQKQSAEICKVSVCFGLRKQRAALRGAPENYRLFQVSRENRTRMGKISRRPASIAQDSTSLLRSL